jgi:hypothetical protein
MSEYMPFLSQSHNGGASESFSSGRSATVSSDELARIYLQAKRHVIEHGYIDEIAWQHCTGPVTPERFVREAAWVILCSGMSESVIHNLFSRFAAELGNFKTSWLVGNVEIARFRALYIFNHERKVDSILEIARMVHALGADGLRRRMLEPEIFLRGLPYIGPVTWRHLAKNLGVPIAKADRHLVRLTEALGRSSVEELCEEVSAWIGDPVPVVDIVFWRWSTLQKRDAFNSRTLLKG